MRYLIHFAFWMTCTTYAYATGLELATVVAYVQIAALAYAAYSYITAPDGPSINQQGPRLGDSKVMTASPGVCIPRIRGAARVAGIVVDKSDIRETAITTTQDIGGKGPDAGSVSQTGYVYDIDLDIMVCRGPAIGIRRIWADQRLIYTVADTSSIGSVAYSKSIAADIRIYLGDQVQGADPTFEALRGVGNVPGYRGRVHVVFESLKLASFGNRIPTLTFEVVMDSPTSPDLPITTLADTSSSSLRSFGDIAIDQFGMVALSGKSGGISFYSAITQTFIAESFIGSAYAIFPGTVVSGAGVGSPASDRAGAFWTQMFGSFTPGGVQLALVKWTSSGVVEKMSYIDNAGTNNPTGYSGKTIAVGPGTYIYFFTGNQIWRATSDFEGLGIQSATLMIAAPGGSGGSLHTDQYGHVWFAGSNASSDTVLYQIAPDTTVYATTIISGAGLTPHTKVVSDDAFLYISYISVAGTTRVIAKIDRTMTLINTTPTPSFSGFQTFDVLSNGNYLVKTGSDWIILQAVTGTTLETTANVAAPSVGHEVAMYNTVGYYGWETSGSVDRLYAVESVPRVALATLDADKAKVGEFVQELLVEAGMVSSQFDTTAIDAIPMDGAIASRVGPARNMIDILRAAYFFDFVETDEKLRAVVRGGSSLVTIPHTDLIVGEDGREPLEVLRGQELDMPERLTVKFINFSNDYQDGSETASRIVTDAEGHVIVEVPLVLTPDKAAQMANVLIDEIMVGRNRITVPTYRKYSRYQPSDVITATTSGGSTLRMRIQDKREVGNRVIFGGVQDDAIVYNPNAAGGSSTVSSSDVGISGPTRMEFLDVPLVIDADNSEGLYISLSGYTGSWPGAAVLRSADGSSFANVGSVVTPTAVGRATTALANYTGGNTVDELSIVTVVLTVGALASITADQLLAGANVAVIGNEVLYFRDATLTAANTYNLTGFLRGRRGTEQHIAGHAINDRFVLMGGSGITRPAMATTDINVDRFYKGVTFGSSQASSPTVTNRNTAAGLKPYSPVFTAGYREAGTNDWKIIWVRRGRLDNNWRDSVDVPLGETTESYSIDIYNAAGTLVLRTLTSVVQSLTYTSAQQVTDFGSSQAAIKVQIYQVSATVGRGFGTGIVQL